jgi:hypothetical protein
VAENWGKDKNQLTLPATNSGPRPGDFPLGSAESRAAARALLWNQQASKPRIEIVTNVEGFNTQWQDFGDVLMRIRYEPMH